MDYYRSCQHAAQTCRYFGISCKTFYTWLKRYEPFQIDSLKENSCRPLKTKAWQVSPIQEISVIALRKKYLCYGKEKLKVLYTQILGELISACKIQRVPAGD